jgi:hypothetical protein
MALMTTCCCHSYYDDEELLLLLLLFISIMIMQDAGLFCVVVIILDFSPIIMSFFPWSSPRSSTLITSEQPAIFLERCMYVSLLISLHFFQNDASLSA